jgi:hypothetical protein
MTSKRHRVTILAAIAATLTAFTLAGCSGSSGSGSLGAAGNAASAAAALSAAIAGTGNPAAAAGDVDVCKLLSAAQATQISGVTYSAATSSHGMCNYTTTDAPVGMFIIIFTGFQGAGDTAWKSELQTLQEDAGDPPMTISGVGDRAAAAGLELGAQTGARIVDIHGGDPNGTGNAFPKSIALAKAVIAALH